MSRKNNEDDRKLRTRKSSIKKSKSQLPEPAEDFNTGSRSPSSLRNVGAGYDDTGMGNSKSSKITEANIQKNPKGNLQKMRAVINTSRKSR